MKSSKTLKETVEISLFKYVEPINNNIIYINRYKYNNNNDNWIIIKGGLSNVNLFCSRQRF